MALALRRESGWSLEHSSAGLPAALYEDQEEPDVDSGRWLEAVITGPKGQSLRIVSAYLHAGAVETVRQAQKMAFLERVDTRISQFSQDSLETLVCGDFNVVRSEQDIKNWKSNHNKTSGVLDQEIAFLNRWMADSLATPGTHPGVDVVRALLPQQSGPYTWWSQRGKAFDNDAGWRIDYHWSTPGLAALAREVQVWRAPDYQARFTDHAPLSVRYDLQQ